MAPLVGRRALVGRFSFFIGPLCVSISSTRWRRRPLRVMRGAEGGRVLYAPGLRVQVGGNQPWRGVHKYDVERELRPANRSIS